MMFGHGRFGKILSRYILWKHGITRQIKLSRLASKFAAPALAALGILVLMLPSLISEKQSGIFPGLIKVLLEICEGLAGALLGSAVALSVARAFALDEEIVTLVAAGTMPKSSAPLDHVKLFQRKLILFYTT